MSTNSAVEDWNKLRAWAIENGHKLILVSAQREHCEDPTTAWLKEWGFVGWDEMYYTHNKHLIDVDVLIDDSPEKLNKFQNESVVGGTPICMKQSWNKKCQDTKMSIDRLSDIIGKVFGD
jgi:5'(3')-deoxyribonucleotidase